MNLSDTLTQALNMVWLLADGKGYSISELSEKMDIQQDSVMRFLETLKNAGFVIIEDQNKYKLVKKSTAYKDLPEHKRLTKEEALLLSKAIDQVEPDHPLSDDLVQKVVALAENKYEPLPFIKNNDVENLTALKKAISKKKKVILQRYKSANSLKITDRVVEPFMINSDYISVWCFEPESNANKIFKISRIEKVEVMDDPWENEHQHKALEVDIFGIGGSERANVKMYLSLRAYNLLVEEYPAAIQHIKPFNEKMYLFDGWICNYEGIGRFVLGLIDEIVVLQPKSFKDFLYDKIKGKRF